MSECESPTASRISVRPSQSPYQRKFPVVRAPKYDLTPTGYKPIHRYRKHWVPPERMPKQGNLQLAEEIVKDLDLDDCLRFLAQATVAPSDRPRYCPKSPEQLVSEISWDTILPVQGEKLTVSQRVSRESSPVKAFRFQSESD